jgi:hypothetical protein
MNIGRICFGSARNPLHAAACYEGRRARSDAPYGAEQSTSSAQNDYNRTGSTKKLAPKVNHPASTVIPSAARNLS